MAIVYSYTRFSTPEQAEGDSLRRQSEAFDKFVEAGNHTVADLTLRDLGVSAFKARNAETGALSVFLDAIRQGRVPTGSILAVEHLDRVSRDEVTKHLNIFLSIINSGVVIATLMDSKTYSVESINRNPMDLMYSIMLMARAHEESKTKSERLASTWETKRKNAMAGKPITRRCPAWITFNESRGKFVLIPERMKVLKRIVKMALAGLGPLKIVKTLTAEGVPAWSTKGVWSFTTVRYYLTSRTLLGEFQLMKGGKPVGDPIPNYYPAALDEQTYYRVQAALRGRTRDVSPGRVGKLSNLFKGLMYWRGVGGVLVRQRLVGDRYSKCYASMGQRQGKSDYSMFSCAAFERAFLSWVAEVDLDAVKRDDEPGQVEELQAQFDELTGKLEVISKAVASVGGTQFKSLVDAMTAIEQQRAVTRERLAAEQARRAAGQPLENGRDINALIELLDRQKTPEARLDVRRRLAGAVRQVVKRIDFHCKPTPDRIGNIAVAHVRLVDDTSRFLAVVLRRGQEASALTDNEHWEGNDGNEYAAKLLDRLAKHSDPEAISDAWVAMLEETVADNPFVGVYRSRLGVVKGRRVKRKQKKSA